MKMKPKITIVCPCWKRAKITEPIMDNLKQFSKKVSKSVAVSVLYILSPEDKNYSFFISKIKQLNEKNGNIKYISIPKKLNAGIREALKTNFDYLMNFGSDNLIHPHIIDLYMPYILSQEPVFGLQGLYFYEKGKRSVFFEYTQNEVVGAGRMIHRTVVKNTILRYGNLYKPEMNWGMDTWSASLMIKTGFPLKQIKQGEFPYIVDIKSETNINSFEKIVNSSRRNNTVKVMKNDIVLRTAYPDYNF